MPDGLDASFYTELRHDRPAAEILDRFAQSTRALIARLTDDLRYGAVGEFGGGNETVLAALADAGRRLNGHVEAFERIVSGSSGNPDHDRMLRNAIANVIADANIAEAAAAHAELPKAKEGKFDQLQGGALAGHYTDLADKMSDLLEILPDELSFFIKLVGLILRDIGIWGDEATGPSLTDVGKQLEEKLDFVMPQLEGLKGGQDRIGTTIADIQRIATMTQQEVNFIETKAETLADLLGRTLVGSSWQINPNKTVSGPNKVPDRDVKQELHDIEDLVRKIIDIIEKTPNGNGNGNGNGGGYDEPHEEDKPVLLDRRLKKIFVYAENVFAPASASERRRIRVRRRAFDLTGWIDLTRMRPGDVFEVDVRVSVAGRKDIPFARTRFDRPRLVAFADFARGLNYVSGSNVLISLRQLASASQFSQPIEVGYQFVVESQ